MNTTEHKIAEEYKKMAKHLQHAAGRSGIVRAVNEPAQTAEVQLTTYDKDSRVEVLLNATPTNDMGIIIYPEVDSDVIVCDVDGKGTYTIVRYGKIKRVQIRLGSGEPELQVTEGAIVMNGGTNDGLVKVNELVGKINAIENLLNSLVIKYNAHTHLYAPGPGTPTPTAATVSLESGTIAPVTNANDLKNDHVKH